MPHAGGRQRRRLALAVCRIADVSTDRRHRSASDVEGTLA
jgi:hypothetical protein